MSNMRFVTKGNLRLFPDILLCDGLIQSSFPGPRSSFCKGHNLHRTEGKVICLHMSHSLANIILCVNFVDPNSLSSECVQRQTTVTINRPAAVCLILYII